MAKLKFNGGSPSLKLERSSFNLSNFTMFDCEQGQLIPTAQYDCVPGDKFNLSTSSLVRTTPLVKPAFTVDLMQKTASFFVAYRTIYKDFEDFFSGGRTGNKIVPLPVINLSLLLRQLSSSGNSSSLYSILDYMGLPTVDSNPTYSFNNADYVNAFYLLAYIKIWNDYFRNPSIDIEVDVLDFTIYYPSSDEAVRASIPVSSFVYNGQSITVKRIDAFIAAVFNTINGNIPSDYRLKNDYSFTDVFKACTKKSFSLDPFKVNLNRDLFTSALPTFSNVDPVSLGITGSVDNTLFSSGLITNNIPGPASSNPLWLKTTDSGELGFLEVPSMSVNLPTNPSGKYNVNYSAGDSVSITSSFNASSLNKFVSGDIGISGIYPRELRLVFGLDLNQQLRNLTGSRYQDLLKAFYGVTVRDYRLNLAEYIGGSRQPVFISEVLQTSESGSTPLGEQGGHAIVSGYGKHGSYFVEELGCILNLFWINSTSLYTQGLRRDWRKFLLDDFFFSSFENLGDQEIFQEELVYTIGGTDTSGGSTYNNTIFGFAPRYSEYKFYNDIVVGGFRGNYRYWTQARIFGIRDVSGEYQGYPVLSPEFLKADFSQNNRIFQTISADYTLKPYLVKFENRTIAFRPMKSSSIGYLIDHF